MKQSKFLFHLYDFSSIVMRTNRITTRELIDYATGVLARIEFLALDRKAVNSCLKVMRV